MPPRIKYVSLMPLRHTSLALQCVHLLSLEPEMTFPGVRILIGCILSALLAWDIIYTPFGLLVLDS